MQLLWHFLNTFKPPRPFPSVLSGALGLVAIMGTSMASVRWLALVGTAGVVAVGLATVLWARLPQTVL